MYEKVRDTIQKFDMLRKGDKVLVCVSGGPDSVFLLNALNNLKSESELEIELFVASLDHGVRGALSAKDSDFVEELSSDMGLECCRGKINLKAVSDKKLSKEENMREARYRFFEDAAAKFGANIIATGHTLDDNAETVLMRIIKGTSLKGLAGIPPVRENAGFKIIRPLIELTKSDILDFLKKKRIRYRIDHTNEDESILRNKVRKKLMPYLAGYNPRIKYALANMASSLREDAELIETKVDLKKHIVKDSQPVFIYLKDLVVQPKALQREIMKDALEKSGANIKKLSYRHWKDMDNFLRHKRKGQSIDLPGDVRIVREESRIVFVARS